MDVVTNLNLQTPNFIFCYTDDCKGALLLWIIYFLAKIKHLCLFF